MATKARQQYFADEVSLSKEKREFSIADEIQQKIDSIEEGAQVNKIETVKVNGTALVPDAYKAVNIDVPEVIDNLYTVDSDNALSAKQGKLLYDYLQNIASRGRFLSNWNSATGLPVTNPTENPYPYKAGDYYSVSNVASGGGTNYRPDGSSYTIGQASTTVETEEVNVSDFYLYDGTNWLLLVNTARQIAVDSSLSTTSTNPVENRVITNALNGKQDVLTAGNHINITNNVISATGFQEKLTAGENITIGNSASLNCKGPCPNGFHIPSNSETISLVLTWYGTLWDEYSGGSSFQNYFKLPPVGLTAYNGLYPATSSSSFWECSTSYNGPYYFLASGGVAPNSSRGSIGGAPIRPFKDTPVPPDSSWTMLYDGSSTAAGAGIFWNSSLGLISVSKNGTTWITIADKNLGATTVWNSGDAATAANAGNTFQWGNNYPFTFAGTWATDGYPTRSATTVDTTGYGPGNYYYNDIFRTGNNDYARWDNPSNNNLWGGTNPTGTWNELVISATDTTYTAGANVQISNQNVISATDTKYTAGTGISIDANNVISNTQTSAEWGNITGTLSDQTDLQNALNIKGDMKYADYNWVTKTGNSIELSLNSEITPSTDFTVNAPSTIKDGQTYLLRVNSGAIAYTMTLGTNMTNPYSEDLTLSANEVSLFAFTAINGNLELQPRMKETDLSNYYTKTETDTLLGDKQDTLTAGTGISIDANNVISSTVTPGQTYTAGNGINISQNNEISADTSVVATQTDLDGKVSKGVNTANGDLFSIESGNYSTSFGPDFIRSEFSSGANSAYSGLQPGSLGSGNNNKESELSPNSLSLRDETDMTQTIYAEGGITVVDDGYGTSEAFEFTSGGNNQIARLKDVKTYTAGDGISIDANNEISNALPGPTIAATAPTGTEGALWYDTTNDVLMAHDGTAWKEAGTQMKVLSYGNSTWQDFLDAYNENAIVYCRASSNTNPATGNQTRMAFMAYVNSTTPTEVEFQYYRSRSDHNTAANQLDQVFVYKLTSASGGTWTVTERNTGAKAVAGTGISLGWGSGNMTISADTTVLATQTDLNSKQDTLVSGTNIKTVNSNSLLGSGDLTLNDVKVSATAPSSPTEGMVWYDTTNNELKVYDGTNWKATGSEYNAGEGIEIGSVVINGRQGPAPEGFHVPSVDEWASLETLMGNAGLSSGNNWKTNLYMPFSGHRYDDGEIDDQGTEGHYWSSTPFSGTGTIAESSSYNLFIATTGNADPRDSSLRSYGCSIRCFKDTPVEIENPLNPGGDWDLIYNVGLGFYIFHSPSLGVITIMKRTSGWEYITIADKNLGATTVYNDGDTLSEANCGKYYQWGNNYGFSWTGAITTSSTQVDASGYGPGNYYSSDTFITRTGDWSSVRNPDLWGDTTGTYTQENVITNTGVLSVNGQTGNITIETFQLAPNSPLNPKYRRYGTQAQYEALAQYYTDEPGDTVYFTI